MMPQGNPHLGDSYPDEFVRSAQAWNVLFTEEDGCGYTAAVWSDAGVGVAAPRVM
jgi:hypothetical protein